MIVVLAGGTGSVKLVRGLARVAGSSLQVIGNVADNFWYHDLYVAPDLDTLMYGLAGRLDRKRGWGLRRDTFRYLREARARGLPTWFRIGDRDLSTHRLRTQLLDEGWPLTEVTRRITQSYGVPIPLLPASDEHVETRVVTEEGDLHLQEFWVRDHAQPRVLHLYYRNAAVADATPDAVAALRRAQLILIAPGNPLSSIGPILALPALRRALETSNAPRVAISPIIGRAPVSGPAAIFMATRSLEVSPVGVARCYGQLITHLAIHTADQTSARRIRELGVIPIITDILLRTGRDERRVAEQLVSTATIRSP